jgi:CRP-like cAMP-binding protein
MDTLATLSLMERLVYLRRAPLFTELSPADLKRIAEIAHEHFYTDGELIAAKGDPGDEMYIIVAGEVRVVSTTEDGDGREIARRKPGGVVGEMSIISQEPRMASLIASGDVRTLTIEQKQFEGILRERPETRLAVLRVLCERLQEAS